MSCTTSGVCSHRTSLNGTKQILPQSRCREHRVSHLHRLHEVVECQLAQLHGELGGLGVVEGGVRRLAVAVLSAL